MVIISGDVASGRKSHESLYMIMTHIYIIIYIYDSSIFDIYMHVQLYISRIYV